MSKTYACQIQEGDLCVTVEVMGGVFKQGGIQNALTGLLNAAKGAKEVHVEIHSPGYFGEEDDDE